jgi:hypothetical protein
MFGQQNTSYWILGMGGPAPRSPFDTAPERANLRFAPVSWMDVGGHLGWVDSSFNVRAGAPVGSSSVPWTLLASYQTDRLGIIQGT